MNKEPIHVTDDAFENTVLESNTPVLGRFLGAVVWPLSYGGSDPGQARRGV